MKKETSLKMSKRFLNALRGMALLCLVLLISCAKEEVVEEPPDVCDGTTYLYSIEIKPIFDQNCATSLCHSGNNSLPDYSNYDGVFRDRIRIGNGITQGLSEITNGRAKLTKRQEQMIICWINRGGPE